MSVGDRPAAYPWKLDRAVYLATRSPRRKELLGNIGIEFRVYDNSFVENVPFHGDPAQFVLALAEQKSRNSLQNIREGLIITADTIVSINGNILEKPIDRRDAVRMLKTLQGTVHQVYTGVCVAAAPEGVMRSGYEVTDVTFAPMTDNEIRWYIDAGEYRDKAGAYAIQGRAAIFIEGIRGCYFNVVGLPLKRLYALIRDVESILLS